MTAAHYKGDHHPGNDLGLHYTALPPIVASCPYSDQLLVTRKFWSPGANRPSQVKSLSFGARTLKGLHYGGGSGAICAVVILGGDCAGNASLSLSSSKRSSASGSVYRVSSNSRPSVVGTCTSIICIAANFSMTLRGESPGA